MAEAQPGTAAAVAPGRPAGDGTWASPLDDWAVACHLHDRAVNPAGPPDELSGDPLGRGAPEPPLVRTSLGVARPAPPAGAGGRP